MGYGYFRSDKMGYRAGKSLIFAIGILKAWGILRVKINRMWDTHIFLMGTLHWPGSKDIRFSFHSV